VVPSDSSGPSPSTGTPAPSGSELHSIRVLLQWTQSAQFGGYLAAVEQGYYESVGLDVTFIAGGPDVLPQVAGSHPAGPEFTISWVPKVLVARAAGDSDLVDIAQIFQRSGTVTLAWKDAAITRPIDLRDQRVGILANGNELEISAGAIAAGLVPGTDFETEALGTSMLPLLRREVDVAQATIYDGYARVLESEDRSTRALVQPTDLDVINWNDEGSAMLQDAVFARADWLAGADNEGVAIAFLRASFQGWMYCRDTPADCVEYAVAARAAGGGGGATASPSPDASATPEAPRGVGHQAWMLNEVNGLIWPSPGGIGVVDPDAWDAMADVLVRTGLLPRPPDDGAYRSDLARAALDELADLDTTGSAFVKGTVEVTPGGE
jgi:NitT/TauT family transport system substrate-binding protein